MTDENDGREASPKGAMAEELTQKLPVPESE